MAGNVNCPYCQTPLNVSEYVGERKYVCPHCMTYIDNPRFASAQEAPNVLQNVERERWRISLVAWLLFGLGIVLGIVLCVCQIAAANASNRDLPRYYTLDRGFALMPGFCGLDLLVIAAIAIPVWRYLTRGRPAMNLGRLLGLVALTIGLAGAVVVFFFAVCDGLPTK
jgi:hypothetical protein